MLGGALAGLAAASAPAAEPPLVTRGFRTVQWKVEQGLPQNTVQCLLQTRDGYLWAGTRFGLLRHDGWQPTRYDHQRLPAMTNDNCVALVEAEDSLWVGTADGLLRWRDRAVPASRRRMGLGDNRIWALTPSRTGGLWIGTANGLNRLQAGAFSSLKPASPDLTPGTVDRHNDVSQLCEDTSGQVWIANRGGLQRLRTDGQSFERIAAHGLISQLAADPAGGVWWSDAGQLYQFAAGHILSRPPPAVGEVGGTAPL